MPTTKQENIKEITVTTIRGEKYVYTNLSSVLVRHKLPEDYPKSRMDEEKMSMKMVKKPGFIDLKVEAMVFDCKIYNTPRLRRKKNTPSRAKRRGKR